MENLKLGFIIISTLLVLTFCSNKNDDADVVFHPVYENLPYSDVPAEMLEIDDAEENYEKLPDQIQLFYNTMNQGLNDDSTSELNVISSSYLDFSSINDSTLLILDKDQDQLIEYNLNKKEVKVIAIEGRGPGDLYFSETLAFQNGKAYVGMQGFQISVFNCQSGSCEHEKVIKTDHNNYTISLSDDFIYFFGIPPFGRENNSNQSNTDQLAIHKMNFNGDLNSSFFPMYDHQSPLVRDRIMSNSEIALFQQLDKVIVSLSRTPYLFVLDLKGEIIKKLELPDFIKPMNFYSTRLNNKNYITTNLWEGDYSYLRSISRINKHWFLIQINEYRNMEQSIKEGITGEKFTAYFALNLDQLILYDIGKEEIRLYGNIKYRQVAGDILIDNDNGTLSITY